MNKETSSCLLLWWHFFQITNVTLCSAECGSETAEQLCVYEVLEDKARQAFNNKLNLAFLFHDVYIQ